MHNGDIVGVLGILFPACTGVGATPLFGQSWKEVLLHGPEHGVRWWKGHNLPQIHHILSVSLFFFTSILSCLPFNHSQGWLAFCPTCLHYTLLQSIWQAEISGRRHILLSVRASGREWDQASQLQPRPRRQTEMQPQSCCQAPQSCFFHCVPCPWPAAGKGLSSPRPVQ